MKPKSSRSGGWIQRSNNDTDNLTSRSTNTTTSTGNHTTIKSSTAKHSKTNNFRSFLTPGYQQNTTTITTKDAFNNTALPILDASVILSPGRYVKKSFPRSSNKWSTSGVDAAQRLVDGRREFVHVVEKELFGDINDSVDRDSGGGNDDERGFSKLYRLSGHGIPNSLLWHLMSVGREWLMHPTTSLDEQTSSINTTREATAPSETQSTTTKSQNDVRISFSNIPNSTLVNSNQVLKTSDKDITSTISLPNEWEHDLELYLVAMDRIASRLGSVAFPTSCTAFVGGGNVATVGTMGSVITLADLKRWNVTVRKGEVPPMGLLVSKSCDGGERATRMPLLTVEWVRESEDCWKVILRVQDDGDGADYDTLETSDRHAKRDPVSLVFEGSYGVQ
eukprot:g2381.t1 g2381   contig11:1353478-1354653(-)